MGGGGVWTYVSLTSALVEGERSASRPYHFIPTKEPRYPLGMRLSGPQNWSGLYGEVKILDPTETRTSTPGSSSL
jgi:hypothetical protein